MPIVVRVLAVLVSLGCVAFAVFTLFTPRQAASAYVPPVGALHTRAAVSAAPGPATALFVGDSYTAGALGINESQTFATRTCDALGLACNLDAEGSTGYQADGHKVSSKFTPYVHRLSEDTALYRADLIVVSGGRNDIGKPGDEFTIARSYLRAVGKAYPKARVVVLEPFWQNAHPSIPMIDIRRDVKRAAAATGATYLPTDGWLLKHGVASDDTHPNLEGHREIAVELTAALKASGLLEQLGAS